MSNTDSFIEEVSEEVRQDKLYAIYKKYGWIAGLLIALIIGGVIYSEWSKASAARTAQANGDALVAALDMDDPTAQASALEAIAQDATTAKPLIEIQRAAVLADAGKIDEAGAVLNAMAVSPDTPKIYRELAALKAVILLGSKMDSEKRHAALDAMIRAEAPFRTIAMEQKALAFVDDGDLKQATGLLTRLLLEPEVPPALRARAEQTLVALGGEVPEIAQTLSDADGLQ